MLCGLNGCGEVRSELFELDEGGKARIEGRGRRLTSCVEKEDSRKWCGENPR